MANITLVEGWGLAGTITDDLGPATPPTLAALGWTVTSGSSRSDELSIITDDGGKSSLKITGTGTYSNQGAALVRYAGSQASDVVMGFSLEQLSPTGNTRMCSLLFSDTPLYSINEAKRFLSLIWDPSNELRLYEGAGGTLGSYVSAPIDLIVAGASNWIEIKYSRSGNSAELWINNALIAQLDVPAEQAAMLDVAACPAGGYLFFRFYGSNGSFTVGDLYVADERLGRCQVITRRPTSDAAVEFGRPQGDSNASQVADPDGSDGDTTYVTSSRSGAEDLYDSSDAVDLTNERIHAVAVTATGRKEDVGNRSLTPIVAQGTAIGAGDPIILQIDNYVGNQSVFNADPGTGSPWTLDGVQSSTFGVRLTD